MTRRPVIDHYMSRDLVTLAPETEITQAAATLVEQNVSGAPVVDASGRMVGILTAKDCFRAMLHASYHQEIGDTVGDHMTTGVQTLEVGTGIVSAAQRFLDCNFRRFPVTRDDRLVGIITRMDLLRAFQLEGAGTPAKD